MAEEQDSKVKMIIPFTCPNCDHGVVMKLEIPSPEVTEIVSVEDADEDIKKLINENSNDTPSELETT